MKLKIFLFYAVVAFCSCSKNENETRPLRKDLTQAVYASGKLFPVNHYTVFCKLPGYVQQIFVKPGDEIKVGDSLLSIRNDQSKVSVSTAANLLKLANENANPDGTLISALRQDLATVKSKYELDSLNFSRSAELLKNNAISKLNFDQSKTQFDISKQNYNKALQTLENTRARLNTELLNAKNQFVAQQLNRNDFIILSAVNGKVYDVIPQVGDLVGPQIPLMEAGDKNNFEVELSVDETDISLVQKNQQVVYSIDAFGSEIFRGTIFEIYPKVNPASKTSRVKATFSTEKNLQLYSGMSVEANIIIAEKKNVLVIPREFIKDGNLVKVKGEKEFRKIKTGASDLQFVEVIEGIEEGTELVKP